MATDRQVALIEDLLSQGIYSDRRVREIRETFGPFHLLSVSKASAVIGKMLAVANQKRAEEAYASTYDGYDHDYTFNMNFVLDPIE